MSKTCEYCKDPLCESLEPCGWMNVSHNQCSRDTQARADKAEARLASMQAEALKWCAVGIDYAEKLARYKSVGLDEDFTRNTIFVEGCIKAAEAIYAAGR